MIANMAKLAKDKVKAATDKLKFLWPGMKKKTESEAEGKKSKSSKKIELEE